MAAKQAMKENLQCTSKYGHLRISQDIRHVRMTDIEGFLTIYGHSDNLLNNKNKYKLTGLQDSRTCIRNSHSHSFDLRVCLRTLPLLYDIKGDSLNISLSNGCFSVKC